MPKDFQSESIIETIQKRMDDPSYIPTGPTYGDVATTTEEDTRMAIAKVNFLRGQEQERERCANDLAECRALLHELIKQSINTDKGTYFSGFIGIHADVLRYLCNCGLMRPCKGYEDRLELLDRDFEATDVIR